MGARQLWVYTGYFFSSLDSIIEHQLIDCIRWHTLEHPYPQNKPHILNGTNFLISLLTDTLFWWPFNPQIITEQCLLPFCHQLQLPSLQHHLGWAALQQNLTPKDLRSNRNLLLYSIDKEAHWTFPKFLYYAFQVQNSDGS